MDDDDHSRELSRSVALMNLRNSDSVVLLDRSDYPDPWVALPAIRALRAHLEAAERGAVAAALAEGGSWAQIGEALGVSRQGACAKHRAAQKRTSEAHHPSSMAEPSEHGVHLIKGELNENGVVLPDGRWVAHDELTTDDRAMIVKHRDRLVSVPARADSTPAEG
jgi:hypothetical protein